MIFRITSKLAIAFLSLALLFLVSPQRVSAQATGVSCIASNYITSWITSLFSGATSRDVNVAENKIRSKEFTLDRLASCAAKQMLHEMTAATVDWINKGFDGKPAFMTNPEAFFLDAADQATGALIAKNGPLSKLCSPWSVDIRLALLIEQAETNFNGVRSSRYACTLGTILRNAQNGRVNVSADIQATNQAMDNFVKNADFSVGGWGGFMELISVTGNNPFSSYLSAQGDKYLAVSEKQAGIKADLTYGLGFLSWEECTDMPANANISIYDPSIKQGSDGMPKICTKKTPGSVIAGSLQKHLNVPATELELADNINAVVNALVNQMVYQVMNKGLLSLSSGGINTSGNRSQAFAAYTSQLYGDSQTSSQTTQTSTSPVMAQINTRFDDINTLVSWPIRDFQEAQACLTDARDNGLVVSTGNNSIPTRQQLDSNSLSEVETSINDMVAYMNSTINPFMNDVSAARIDVSNLLSPTDTELTRILTTTVNTLYDRATDIANQTSIKASNYQSQCDAL